MEPERKIEKLLRAYAKKRRADAGDPLKLHPATRRLLQGEVARKKPRSNRPNRPDDEEAMSVSLLELFRQRWALLTSFALVVFFGAALFLPALSKAKRKAASITAMNNLKQIGVAAQMAANENYGKLPASLETLTNGLASDKILTDPQTGKPFVYVAGGERLDVLSSNAVLAYSPENKKTHTVLFADGRVEIVNGAKFSELTNRVVTEFVLARGSAPRQLAEPQATVTVAAGNVVAAPSAQSLSKAETDRSREALSDTVATTTGTGMLAVNSPAPAASASAGLAKDFGAQTGSIQFAATQDFNSSTQNSFKNTRAPAKAASVLANFQVQQAGNAIRVVDSDGSVYDGELQPENEKKEQIPAGTLQAPGERAKTIARRDEPQMTQNSQAAQNYFFRVTGTNLTLKQNVVFAGNVVANSKAGQNQQQAYDNKGAAGGAQSQSMLKNQLLWSNSRIAGTAVVANTNNIEINAEPQSP